MMSKGNGNQKDTCLVKCRLEPGMFKGEWLVFLDAINPENQQELKVQLFADQREVTRIQGTPKKNQPAWGWLGVSLVKAKNGLAQVGIRKQDTKLAFIPEFIEKHPGDRAALCLLYPFLRGFHNEKIIHDLRETREAEATLQHF